MGITFEDLLTLFAVECMCIAGQVQHAAEAVTAMAVKANEMFSGTAATPENKKAVMRVITSMAAAA